MKGKPVAVGSIAAVALVAAIVILLSQATGRRPGGSGASYFYDLKTGKLFIAKAKGMPPIQAPEGGADAGAMAHVFACGNCEPSQLKVVAIEMLSSEARSIQKQMEVDPRSVPPETVSKVMATGSLIAEPPVAGKEPQWAVKGTPSGFAILAKTQTLCDGKPGTQCSP